MPEKVDYGKIARRRGEAEESLAARQRALELLREYESLCWYDDAGLAHLKAERDA